ncbi:MAG: 7-cyano-7-deazaguanine synthase QueC [Myxococcales bacterium]
MTSQRAAVVLLSGGLDSATCLAIARADGFAVHALTVDYGQRHAQELTQAQTVARALGVASHRVVRLDLRAIGGSSLTSDTPVPKDRDEAAMAGEIPVTYVPARNTVFLGIALGLAEVVGAADLYVGVNALDYSGYPDCRPEFVRAFEALAQVATKAGVEGTRFTVHAPLMHLTKAEIIRRGAALGLDYGLTHSCYDPGPDGGACGRCDSCQLRRKGFREAGVPDPTRYSQQP